MADYTIEDVFEEVYKREFEEFEDLDSLPVPRFSLRHKIRMKRIFKRFRRNTAKLYAVHIRFNRRTVLAFLMIILLAAVSACAAIKIIGDFLYERHEDNTQLFAANVEGAPEILEEIYMLTALPDEYECTSDNLPDESIPVFRCCIFTHKITGQTVLFRQSVKSLYNAHYDTEGYYFEDTTVAGHNGLYIDYSYDDTIAGAIVWDNGDYIFHIDGDFSKEELIHLAETIKIQ